MMDATRFLRRELFRTPELHRSSEITYTAAAVPPEAVVLVHSIHLARPVRVCFAVVLFPHHHPSAAARPADISDLD